MSLEELISNYGYAAIGIGTFLEGETILIIGGFAAHRGYLELPGVILSAFLGTLLGDQFYYYIGRRRGRGAIDKRPALKARSEKVFAMLDRHQTWLILGFRFVYGIRTITPFLVGASGIPPLRFLFLNAIGGIAWSVVIGSLGYLFGQTLEIFLGDLKKYELLAFAVLAGAGLLAWIVHLRKKPAAGPDAGCGHD